MDPYGARSVTKQEVALRGRWQAAKFFFTVVACRPDTVRLDRQTAYQVTARRETAFRGTRPYPI